MRETFSTHKNGKDDNNTSKRERLQSQGATVKTPGIILENVKQSRKPQHDELNQTMQVTTDNKFGETIDVPIS